MVGLMIRSRVFLGSEVCSACVASGRLEDCLRTEYVIGRERRERRKVKVARSAAGPPAPHDDQPPQSAGAGAGHHSRNPPSSASSGAEGRIRVRYEIICTLRPYVRIGRHGCGCPEGSRARAHRVIINVTPRPRVIRAWVSGTRVPTYILQLHSSGSLSLSSHSSTSHSSRSSRDQEPDARHPPRDQHPTSASSSDEGRFATSSSHPSFRTGTSTSAKPPSLTSHPGPLQSHFSHPSHPPPSHHSPRQSAFRQLPASPRLPILNSSSQPRSSTVHSHFPSLTSTTTISSVPSTSVPIPTIVVDRPAAARPDVPLSQPPSSQSTVRTQRRLPSVSSSSTSSIPNLPQPQSRRPPSVSSSEQYSFLTRFPERVKRVISPPKPRPTPASPPATAAQSTPTPSEAAAAAAEQKRIAMSKLRTAPPGVAPTLHPKITEYRQQLQKQKGLVSEIAFGEILDREVRVKIHRAFSAVEPYAIMDPEYTGILQNLEYPSLKRLSEDLEALLVKWYPELMPKPHTPPSTPDLKETSSGASGRSRSGSEPPKRGLVAKLLCK